MTNRHNPDLALDRQISQVLRSLSFSVTILASSLTAIAQESALAATPEPTESISIPDAATLLRQAREKLATYRTLKAKMVEIVEFGPRRFKAEGTYLQGTDHRVRVDVEVAVGKNTGRLLQVSEGDVLWTVYDVGTKPKITRRDVNQILAAAAGADAEATQLAELGLGGLPAMLASVERWIKFDTPTTATIEGRTFYVLEGEWKPEFRAQFEQQAQSLPKPTDKPRPLPSHVPDLVRVFLDAETFFPYRIRYLKRAPTAGTEPAPILTLDFRDIVVNASLDPSEFRYTPPSEADVADITSFYLQQIRGDAATPGPQTTPTPVGQ